MRGLKRVIGGWLGGVAERALGATAYGETPMRALPRMTSGERFEDIAKVRFDSVSKCRYVLNDRATATSVRKDRLVAERPFLHAETLKLTHRPT